MRQCCIDAQGISGRTICNWPSEQSFCKADRAERLMIQAAKPKRSQHIKS